MIFKIEHPHWDIVVSRVQLAGKTAAERTIRGNYNVKEKAPEIGYTPNGRNLFNIIKDRMSEDIEYKVNRIKLRNGLSFKAFVKRVNELHNERFNTDAENERR